MFLTLAPANPIASVTPNVISTVSTSSLAVPTSSTASSPPLVPAEEYKTYPDSGSVLLSCVYRIQSMLQQLLMDILELTSDWMINCMQIYQVNFKMSCGIQVAEARCRYEPWLVQHLVKMRTYISFKRNSFKDKDMLTLIWALKCIWFVFIYCLFVF